jgi:serine/threonine-protein kinase HipA
LEKGQTEFHSTCSRRIFGSAQPPELPYTHSQIADLALQVIRNQTTVTGVQPKLSLDIVGEHTPKRFTIVGLWGKYILKPQTELFEQLPENEDLTMHLAEIAGIKTVPHSLIRFADNELFYITKRIDRGSNGEKLPMEDMCQLTERPTEYKYKGSYEQIAKIIVKFSAAPKLDLANFWELVLFCWLTGNADMHLKSFSLYNYISDNYNLCPAYGLLSTVLAMPEDTEELALTLNEKKKKLKQDDFWLAFTNSGLAQKVTENIFLKMKKIAPKWLNAIDNSFLNEANKEKYKAIINERFRKLTL